MTVPSFSDLGKSAREVFKSGYHYGKGLFKVAVKTKSAESDKASLSSDLAYTVDSSKLTGMIQAGYKTDTYGYFTEKLSTDGTFLMGYELSGKFMEKLDLMSELTYNPQTSAKVVKFGAKFSNDFLNGLCTVSNNFNKHVTLFGTVVVAIKELFLGYQCGYNTETSSVTKNDLGLAFNLYDVGVHMRCTSIPYEYGLSVLYKVNDEWETAVNGIYARSDGWQDWTMGVAAKYKLDEDSTLRLKFNSDLQLGTGLQRKLNDNVSVSLSFNVDCANVTKGGHKVGLAIDLEG